MKKDKLLAKLLNNPKDYRWEELVIVLKSFGYQEEPTGKTGGSRRRFTSKDKKALTFHKPHPKGILKSYQVKQVIETLKAEGLI